MTTTTASWINRRKILRQLRQRQVRLQASHRKVPVSRAPVPPPVHSAGGFDALFSPYVHGPSTFSCSFPTGSRIIGALQRRITTA